MDQPPVRPHQSAAPDDMMPSHGIYNHQQPMNGIEAPHSNDVLSGRGVTTNRHVGNENFRRLVNCNKELYVTSTKRQKMTISRSIVEAVRNLDPPGRFLEKDPTSGLWFDIGDKKAVEKTSQALRDGAASLRKQLSEDLSDPDFLSAVFDDDVKISAEKKAPEKGKPAVVKAKKTVKCHRRTFSSPAATTAASKLNPALKKQRSGELEYPSSPASAAAAACMDRMRQRGSFPNVPIPRPSASPLSPKSSHAYMSFARPPATPTSPRSFMPAAAKHGHQRTQSAGAAIPVLSPGSPTSMFQLPPRNGTYGSGGSRGYPVNNLVQRPENERMNGSNSDITRHLSLPDRMPSHSPSPYPQQYPSTMSRHSFSHHYPGGTPPISPRSSPLLNFGQRPSAGGTPPLSPHYRNRISPPGGFRPSLSPRLSRSPRLSLSPRPSHSPHQLHSPHSWSPQPNSLSPYPYVHPSDPNTAGRTYQDSGSNGKSHHHPSPASSSRGPSLSVPNLGGEANHSCSVVRPSPKHQLPQYKSTAFDTAPPVPPAHCDFSPPQYVRQRYSPGPYTQLTSPGKSTSTGREPTASQQNVSKRVGEKQNTNRRDGTDSGSVQDVTMKTEDEDENVPKVTPSPTNLKHKKRPHETNHSDDTAMESPKPHTFSILEGDENSSSPEHSEPLGENLCPSPVPFKAGRLDIDDPLFIEFNDLPDHILSLPISPMDRNEDS